MKGFYTVIRGILYLPFKLLYPVKVIGKHNLPKKGERQVTVSNHLKWVDMPMVAISVPGYRHFVAKKEIGKNPFIRVLAKGLGVIFVDRQKPELSTIRECIDILKKGEPISMFPEGTRNRDTDSMQEVKSGAAMFAIKGDAYIVPVMIYNRFKMFRRNYIYVGQPFKLTENANVRLNSEVLASATKLLGDNMQIAKTELDEYVERKNEVKDSGLKGSARLSYKFAKKHLKGITVKD